jgi:hypothetical protein
MLPLPGSFSINRSYLHFPAPFDHRAIIISGGDFNFEVTDP